MFYDAIVNGIIIYHYVYCYFLNFFIQDVTIYKSLYSFLMLNIPKFY